MKTGVELIAEERQRQQEKEGWTKEHDQEHCNGELALAAAAYAVAEDARNRYKDDLIPGFWPFEVTAWKPSPEDRVKELTKAGALIAAEIDRLENIEKPKPPTVSREDMLDHGAY